ncbi:Bifunctional oligoribonuclease and PAP phosphatase NrnA [subsurface metagenome]|nr:bifunctional oligoribonuclease/PAP phosphatase NrnA [Clostridia bacterium]
MQKRLKREKKKIINKILKVIRENRTFFISSHMKPDGDSIGAQLVLASFLRRLGKDVYIANRDPVPVIYQFLLHSSDIHIVEKVERNFDVAFILDCGDLQRVGNIIDLKNRVKIIINIDHHVDCELFGDYNYVEPRASSVAEELYDIFKQAHLEIIEEEALALYVGILTDTGRFQEANTTPRCHEIVAELISKGISPQVVSQKVYEARTEPGLKLLSLTLSTLEVTADGKIALLLITQDMYKKTGARDDEVEGFVNFAREMEGVEVGVLFKETNVSNQLRVSFRSKGKIDVSKIARLFGGGGHRNAAGCAIQGAVEEVKQKVLKAISQEADNTG